MEVESKKLKVADQEIAVKLYKPKSNHQNIALLFIHGWTGQPNENAATFVAEHGYTSLTIVLRGHEGSDGDIKAISAQDSLDDAKVAYDFLASQVPRGKSIIAVGSSYGSYIAVLLSEIRELIGLSLRVPAAYPDELFGFPKWGRGSEDPAVAAWRHTKVAHDQNLAFNQLHNFNGQIQIIEAENDDQVPHETVQNYLNAVAGKEKLEYKVMKDWPHSLGSDEKRNAEFKEVLLSWLERV